MNENPITLDGLVRRLGDHPSSDIGDEVVLMNVESGNYYGLGATGTRIWALIAEPIRVGAVCEALTEEFDVSEADCRTQVTRFLEQLRSEGLIDVVAEKAS